MFHEIVREERPDWWIHTHPSDGMRYRACCLGDQDHEPEPPLKRNITMLEATDALVAAPDGPERLRSGTWSTIRQALKRGMGVTIIWPDGKIERK